MATHIGTLESEIEVVDSPAPAAGPADASSSALDDRARRRQEARRERARILRTYAEGTSD